jgi:hypothetical protein
MPRRADIHFGDCERCAGSALLLCRGVAVTGADVRPCQAAARMVEVALLDTLRTCKRPLTAAALARRLGSGGAKDGPLGSHHITVILAALVQAGTVSAVGEAQSGSKRMPTYALSKTPQTRKARSG